MTEITNRITKHTLDQLLLKYEHYQLNFYFRTCNIMKLNNALIIDDEMDICMLLANFLKKKSRHVSYSNSLNAGLDKCREEAPDLLILDHNLPDGYGIEKIPEFRKIKRPICIVVISAMSHLKNKAMENGADYFIEKPISFKKLDDIISNQNIS